MKQPELTILQRLQAPIPSFFKPIIQVGVIIAAIAAGLITTKTQLANNGFPLPDAVAKVIEILGYVSAGISSVLTLTVDWDALKTKTVLDNIKARVSARV